MNEALKWIGGTSVVAAVLLGSAVIAGNALEAHDAAPSEACYERLFTRGKGAAAKKLKYIGLTRGNAAGVRSNG